MAELSDSRHQASNKKRFVAATAVHGQPDHRARCSNFSYVTNVSLWLSFRREISKSDVHMRMV